MPDPTADEMLAFLLAQPCRGEDDTDDAKIAIYWFASEWHGGQASNLYSALSTSDYTPGRSMRGPESEGETVRDMVCELEEKFAGVDYSDRDPCELGLERGPVWMLWHGGSSYGQADQMNREDCERFETLGAALDEFESRENDPYYPCVSRASSEDGGPSAWICFADPFGLSDVYPDATVEFNRRGNAVATSA